MTREEAKKAAEVMMAYADGKDVEYRLYGDNKWETFNGNDKEHHLTIDFFNYIYRIKKEPSYRPFKSKEECWNELLKHQPFGWTMAREAFRQVLTIGNCYVCFNGITLDYNEAFNEVKFSDGTPFGIKEERK